MLVRNLLTPLYLDQWRDVYEKVEIPNLVINRMSHAAGPDIQHRVLPTYRYAADFVSKTVKDGNMPVTWFGDCCMAIPTLAGLQQAGIEPALIWFDAHGDFNTWETTPSGYLGGMPLAMLVGLGEQTILRGLGMRAIFEKDVVLTDARDLDPEEGALIAGSKITYHHRVSKLISEVDLPEKPIWVHFDVDLMRVEDSPATNYPTPGGPTLEALDAVFRRIQTSERLCAVSVSMWEPSHPQAAESEAVVKRLVKVLTG